MALDFRSQVFEGMASIPSSAFVAPSCDMEPAYRYHRRVLQLLQWRCPPERWWLKTPAHMHSIDALNRVYPDARFVMTHRDVGKVLPSVCAVFEALSNILTTNPDPLAIGAHNSALWRYSLQRLIDFGTAATRPLLRRLVREVQTRSNGRGGEALRRARRRSQCRRPSAHAGLVGGELEGALGTAPYKAETYGLDPATIREQFAFYYDRFDVALED